MRIRIEIANDEGVPEYHSFITPVTGTATFPVIQSIDKKIAFVAYTNATNGKDSVGFAVVRLSGL